MNDQSFLPKKGNYRNLKAFQKAECIYDITFYFANKYFKKGDRTIDQMIQAARSGRQNIAEGAEAGVTSTQTEIKLTNVARASLQELLLDYEDFLRVRNLEIWGVNSEKGMRCRDACKNHNDSAYYREAILKRNETAIANIAITLIRQADMLLRGYIAKLEQRFIHEGGIRERMYQARLKSRNGGLEPSKKN